MNTPTGTNPSSDLDTLKKDVHGFAKDTTKLAHDHLIDPVVTTLHNAGQAV